MADINAGGIRTFITFRPDTSTCRQPVTVPFVSNLNDLAENAPIGRLCGNERVVFKLLSPADVTVYD